MTAFRFRAADGRPDYWRDVGTPTGYWLAHLDLLGEQPRLRLDDPRWPMSPVVKCPPQLSARFAGRPPVAGGSDASLLARYVHVDGAVRRCVLFDGTYVGAGALVEDAVILPGAQIGANCRLRGVVVDRECKVPDGTVVMGPCAPRHASDAAIPVVLTAETFAARSRGLAEAECAPAAAMAQ